MRFHLHVDENNGHHARVTVFIDRANCGQLTMKSRELVRFGVNMARGCDMAIPPDEFEASGHVMPMAEAATEATESPGSE